MSSTLWHPIDNSALDVKSTFLSELTHYYLTHLAWVGYFDRATTRVSSSIIFQEHFDLMTRYLIPIMTLTLTEVSSCPKLSLFLLNQGEVVPIYIATWKLESNILRLKLKLTKLTTELRYLLTVVVVLCFF